MSRFLSERSSYPQKFKSCPSLQGVAHRPAYGHPFLGSFAKPRPELRLEDKVLFREHTDRIAEIYSALDIFVLPSKREGFSRSILEAMSAGLPVLATQLTEIEEAVVEGQNGLLVPHGDLEALRRAALTLAQDRGLRETMGALNREKVEKKFSLLAHARSMEMIYSQISKTGEPGIYWTNDLDWGTNPCCEIGLRPFQFCNLCEINVNDVASQRDLNERAQVASFFGTLQAGFTDFHYLRPIWKTTTEMDALLGIGMTGIGSGRILEFDLEHASVLARAENERIADKIGINHASRLTCIKPSGTTSCVLGCSSGIHAWQNDYYLRTIRFGLDEAIAQYLLNNHPELCELDEQRPHDTLCVRFPIAAPHNSILRTEPVFQTLERVKHFSLNWVINGHIAGLNTHNVSATIYVKDDEADAIGQWMWDNKDYYNGLSVFPYWGGDFPQAPFQDITKEEYERRIEHLKHLDLSIVKEEDDNVQFGQVAACAGAQCEVQV